MTRGKNDLATRALGKAAPIVSQPAMQKAKVGGSSSNPFNAGTIQ